MKLKGKLREKNDNRDPISFLLALIRAGRWRAKVTMQELLDQIRVSESTWESVRGGDRRLQSGHVKGIADALDMDDAEYQRMIMLAGYRESLEDEIPTARIRWAYKCYMDNPEKGGVDFKAKEIETVPLAIQAYMVTRYLDLDTPSLLREVEIDAIRDWLVRNFRVDFGVGPEGVKDDLRDICSHPAFGFGRSGGARIQRLMESLVRSRSRPWIAEMDIYWSDLNEYTRVGTRRYGDEDDEWQLDERLDAKIESERGPACGQQP